MVKHSRKVGAICILQLIILNNCSFFLFLEYLWVKSWVNVNFRYRYQSVPKSAPPITGCYGPNEHLKFEKTLCENNTCTKALSGPFPCALLIEKVTWCDCMSGYFRNSTGNCVTRQQCIDEQNGSLECQGKIWFGILLYCNWVQALSFKHSIQFIAFLFERFIWNLKNSFNIYFEQLTYTPSCLFYKIAFNFRYCCN